MAEIMCSGRQRDDVLFYCEFKRALSLLNTCILSDRFTDLIEENVKVCIEENTITIQEKGKKLCCDFGDAKLSPLTCRGLKFLPRGEIQFSIHIDSPANQNNTPTMKHTKQSDFVEKILDFQDRCFCAVCGQKILADHSFFTKVLALPSENWSEYADMWFCHKHEGEEGHEELHNMKNLLLPKNKQCLVGDSYFLLRDNQVKVGHVKVEEDMLKCQRCGSQLGVVYTGDATDDQSYKDTKVFKIFRHSVLFHRLEEDDTQKTPDFVLEMEDYFANLIVEQSHLYTSFRLIIEAELDDRTITCLIWMIDPSLMVYIDHGSINQSHLHLQPIKVLKMLYKCKVRHTGSPASPDYMFSSWRTDDAVHHIKLPYPMCLQLVTCLVHNTRRIPRSHRFLNKFIVGFLRYKDSTG